MTAPNQGPLVAGIDLGTTTITALAIDAGSGEIVARGTAANTAQITSADDRTRGRSEWDARQIATIALGCLREIAAQLTGRQVAGIGLTGQQHGMLLLDADGRPVSPLFNWQDRRGEEAMPGGETTYVQRMQQLVGEDAPERTGCRLATGYLGVTLFWLREQGQLPENAATAAFVMDYLGRVLTDAPVAMDPTAAASSGLVDLRTRDWDRDALAACDLPAELFPPIHEAPHALGGLTAELAAATGLTAGTPVFAALGDNQAAVLGSVANLPNSVLVNVGTGAQVAAYVDEFRYASGLETRPFVTRGNLLVSAGLCGGRSYALLESFFRSVLETFGAPSEESLFSIMNRLAAEVPAGADYLQFVPLFTGTRHEPHLRASLSGISPGNFTPAHLTRALLEGMADVFHDGFAKIRAAAGRDFTALVGAGNGIRENVVLRGILAERFGLPVRVPRHREESAFGAALLAGEGCGAVEASRMGELIQYQAT